MSLNISDDIDVSSLSSFELKRLDYFGSIGLYLDKIDSLEILVNNDTIKIIPQLSLDSIPISSIDTVDVRQIIRAMQEVGN